MSSGDGLRARRTTMEDRDNDASLELATSMTESTPPGESETLTFIPVETGESAPLCYDPGRAATGTWVRSVVSSDGETGFEASSGGGS